MCAINYMCVINYMCAIICVLLYVCLLTAKLLAGILVVCVTYTHNGVCTYITYVYECVS